MGEGADLLIDRWGGDLRRLHEEAGPDPQRIHELLTAFKGIGPTGADIFLREVQGIWPDVAPRLDERVIAGAKRLDLPTKPDELADLVDSPVDLARLASALVRVSHEPDSQLELFSSNLGEATRGGAAR